jgi:hypothetical protein
MQYRPDIVISDRFGVAVAIIEVKALNGAGVQTATRYLSNLLAHGVVPRARYVMLITPDAGYLWSTPEAVLRESPPTVTFPMDRVIQRYLPPNGVPTPVRDLVLEAIVQQWLWDLADGIVEDDDVVSSLRQSGFLDAVRDGLVNAHASA